MRPKTIVAGAVMLTVLALVAAPGIAGSRTPAPYEPVPAAAFQQLTTSATDGSTVSVTGYDAAYDSASRLTAAELFTVPAGPEADAIPLLSRNVAQPDPGAARVYKPAKYVLHGEASFYNNGTTAMRLPQGTVIRVCGAAGCLERTVTDYGPTAGTKRIIDLYRPDFFAVCGCASWSGVTNVAVYVY